ncbi:hypothetical protein [Acinetobacter baumannii]|uniref:hypothetical protein n=1 Tax=Acinetobacter baumannii TaxID=470 RepID=UPI0029418F1A|nr:hypothetical protein [Acinetobacter baumannii]MDV4223606.1 hypothetical protein [Acinetobacter baumannii]
MKIKFQYVLREEYEGDEGVYVPTLGWEVTPYKNQAEGFDAYLRGDEDFLDFISSIDNLELISEALLKIESILRNQRKEIIFSPYGDMGGSAKFTKEITTFKLRTNKTKNYRGEISTELFLKVLIQWKKYLESNTKECEAVVI